MRLFWPEDMGADAADEEPFGPYLVYERLGVGGMATVHRALERGIEGFERMVALKRLLPHLAMDATFIKSFVREAKLASVLNHVNIVQIFELGRVGTQYFISMEYIDGRDIRRILRHARRISGPPPIHVTVGLLLQLCEALDYAHHKVDDTGHPMGLVHRDVSPSNVLVTSAGQVKVIDFGIAKAQSAQLRTQTGRVKGKLAYMAPEALSGKDLDARSDLFAAGVIAHELLTARPLFAAKNEYQTLMKVQRGEVMPPSAFNQACPAELDAIVLRTLARDPDDRFTGAGELRDQLHALRKQFGLQTADRDIASWMDWAFQLEPPSEATSGATGAAMTGAAGGEPGARARSERLARPRRPDDDEAVDLAWGGHEDHGNGEPVVLDDVPDVSDKHLQSASALGAEVRLDLDDLADGLSDDIPTPAPPPARPFDLAARTVTAPQLPRALARSKAAAARVSQAVPARRADDRSGASPAPFAGPAPAIDDGATQIEISPIVPAVRSALVPSRTRTLTMPPRPLPAGSVAPRAAAATLPPRVAPAANEPSRGVPLPAAPSRSNAVAADRSRSAAIPAVRSRTGQVAVPAPAASGLEASHGVPVAVEPAYPGPAPAGSSRSWPLPAPPSRSGPAAILPPRAVPSSSVAPRERSRTSSDTPAPDLTEPPTTGRDTLLDVTATERNPVDAGDDLGLASDTMIAIPALPSMDTQTSVSVRFRAPSAPPPSTTTAAAAVPPPATATLPAPAAEPPAAAEPSATAPPALDVATTATHRKRLITPATALFADPEPDAAGATASAVTVAPAASSTLPDASSLAGRRIPLGRVVLVVLGLVLVSAATTAAALYLTRDPEASRPPRPAPPPAPDKALGTVELTVVPADAHIAISGKSITGKRVHHGSPWSPELAPGGYQIEIDREGYKGWLTAIDVVAGQRQALQVPLEALGSAVIAEATLVVGSSPGGLDITVDGVSFARTPGKVSITAGHHVVALRAGEAEVWRRDIDARASAIYEFHPVIAPPAAAPPTASGSAAGSPASPVDLAPGSSEPAPAGTTGSAAPPAAGETPPAGPAMPPSAAPPPAAPATPAPATAAAPITVPSSAVTRIAGAALRITAPASASLPATISALLCIDDAGRVVSVKLQTPLDADLAGQITAALRAWEYAPYTAGGAPRPVCFLTGFRT